MKSNIFTAFTLVFGLWSAQILAQTPQEDGAILASALADARSKDWLAATETAQKLSDPVGVEIIDWMRLRAGEATFAEYEFFLTENTDWPGLKRLQYAGEAHIPMNLPPARVVSYFSARLPQSGIGAIRLAAAYDALGNQESADAEAVRAWLSLTMTRAEISQLADQFPEVLANYHVARLDWLLWEGHKKSAEAMLVFVDEDVQKLAIARLALQNDINGVDGLIAAVPDALKDDPGLAYDRFLWRVKKGYWDSANDMLVERSRTAQRLGRPEYWANRRRGFARRAMRDGNIDLAYSLASSHYLDSGSDYADLEWLAGFLALKKMDKPEQALTHFTNFRGAIQSPISVGRAGYWLGLTHEALNDDEAAQAAFSMAAAFQTSFYGQLAAEHISAAPDVLLQGRELPPDWTLSPFLTHESVRAAVLFYFAQEPLLARQFFSHESEMLDIAGKTALGQLTIDLELPNTALAIAKLAAKDAIVLPDAYYPVTELAAFSTTIPPELAMAIARQESELYPQAQSHAGARGLMQVMPATARDVTKSIDISFSNNRLLVDWQYNALIGTTYMAGLVEEFDGSYLLAVAAYNAGPSRVHSWIETYGDPRLPDVDPVIWAETIPFRETRNYVQRVMEALYVYRARISGEVPDLQLSIELRSRLAE